ncbi:MAG: hypothetical protein ACJ0UT_08145 [Candidatus Latescibacterota bacterium]
MELLKELCESAGVPGREGRLREIVCRELEPLADDIRVDALGNLIALKKASKTRKPKKMMIAAHMDEIGFVVSHIDDRGWLRLGTFGRTRPAQYGSTARCCQRSEEGPAGAALSGDSAAAYCDAGRSRPQADSQGFCSRLVSSRR